MENSTSKTTLEIECGDAIYISTLNDQNIEKEHHSRTDCEIFECSSLEKRKKIEYRVNIYKTLAYINTCLRKLERRQG